MRTSPIEAKEPFSKIEGEDEPLGASPPPPPPPQPPAPSTGPPRPNHAPAEKSVVVVGAGLSGLLAAHELARQGFAVDVYDRLQAPDGPGDGTDAYTADHAVLLTPAAEEALAGMGLDARGLCDFKEIDGVAIHDNAEHRLLPARAGPGPISVSSRALAGAVLSRLEREYASRVSFHWGSRVEVINSGRQLLVVSLRDRTGWRRAPTPPLPPAHPPRATPPLCSPRPLQVSQSLPQTLSAAEQPSRKVTNVKYEILVGADGRGSATRTCLADQVEGLAFETGTEQGHLHFFATAPPAEGSKLPETWASKCGVWIGAVKLPSSVHSANVHLSTLPHPSGAVQVFASMPTRLVEGFKKKTVAELALGIVSALPGLPRTWAEEVAQAVKTLPTGQAASLGATTRGNAYHGAREVLVGDAAHSMTPSLWLSTSAAIMGVAALSSALAPASGDPSRAAALLPGYSKAWLHDAFSAADISEQIFEDPKPPRRIPSKFRRKERHIERLAPVETLVMYLASKLFPRLVPAPGVWRLLHTKDRFSDIYRDMRKERSLSSRAFVTVGSLAVVALFFVVRVFLGGAVMA